MTWVPDPKGGVRQRYRVEQGDGEWLLIDGKTESVIAHAKTKGPLEMVNVAVTRFDNCGCFMAPWPTCKCDYHALKHLMAACDEVLKNEALYADYMATMTPIEDAVANIEESRERR